MTSVLTDQCICHYPLLFVIFYFFLLTPLVFHFCPWNHLWSFTKNIFNDCKVLLSEVSLFLTMTVWIWFTPSIRRRHAGLSLLSTQWLLLSAVSCTCRHEAPLGVFVFVRWKQLRWTSMIHHHLLTVIADLVFSLQNKTFKCHSI